MTRRRWPLLCWLAATVVVAGCSGNMGALDPQSDQASAIAVLWWAMVAAGTAVLVLVLVLLVWAGRRPRPDADGNDGQRQRRRPRNLVVWGGIVLPIVVLVPLSVGMLVVSSETASRTGSEDLEVHVIGHQYWWEVRYPDAEVVTANEIRLPVDESVRFRLETDDVIHSFWIPQLGGKVDMIPGNETVLRLTPRQVGEFTGICAEFCGLQHARMRLLTVVQTRAEFDDWLAEQARPAAVPSAEGSRRGQEVFEAAGCASCHTVQGTQAEGELGPDLTHVASRSHLAALVVPNDRDHLARWIVDPDSIKPGSLMPPTLLDPSQLDDLLDYLEALP